MNGFEHPGTIFLIHAKKVREEMESGLRAQNDGPQPDDRHGPSRLRIAVSNGLIALARRIAPEPTADAGIPAAARH